MEREQAALSSGQRTMLTVIAVGWVGLGMWSLSEGSTYLGIAQLALAGLCAASLASPKLAAFWTAPLFRRN